MRTVCPSRVVNDSGRPDVPVEVEHCDIRVVVDAVVTEVRTTLDVGNRQRAADLHADGIDVMVPEYWLRKLSQRQRDVQAIEAEGDAVQIAPSLRTCWVRSMKPVRWVFSFVFFVVVSVLSVESDRPPGVSCRAGTGCFLSFARGLLGGVVVAGEQAGPEFPGYSLQGGECGPERALQSQQVRELTGTSNQGGEQSA